MTTATTQPMTTFAMIETARRLLSVGDCRICLHPGNVARCDRFGDNGEFQAVQFGPQDKTVFGTWTPDDDSWQYPEDIAEFADGVFVAV